VGRRRGIIDPHASPFGEQGARKKRAPEGARPLRQCARSLVTTEQSCAPGDHRPQAEHQRPAR
jgi:hypothetical protein